MGTIKDRNGREELYKIDLNELDEFITTDENQNRQEKYQ